MKVTLWHLGHLLCNCSQQSSRHKMPGLMEDPGGTLGLQHLVKESEKTNIPLKRY